MNTFVKLLIALNILNVIDAIQTYVCVSYFVCVDLNPYAYHGWFYVLKILSIIAVSVMLYYAYTRLSGLHKKAILYLTVTVTALYTSVVLSNMLILSLFYFC
jgi:hypothetical protein